MQRRKTQSTSLHNEENTASWISLTDSLTLSRSHSHSHSLPLSPTPSLSLSLSLSCAVTFRCQFNTTEVCTSKT